MTISINEIESGIGLVINGQVFMVQEYQHVKPGKGSAFARVRIKNVKTHQVLERTFRSSESLDDIELEEKRQAQEKQKGLIIKRLKIKDIASTAHRIFIGRRPFFNLYKYST